MKLKLKEPWCLRGYRGDLFVLEKSGSIEIPYRLKYPLYELLSKCDGVTEIDKEYEEKFRPFIEKYIEMGVLEKTTVPSKIKDWQEYVFFDNRRVPQGFFSITGRCNLNCIHCFSATEYGKEIFEFSPEQIEHILDKFLSCGIRNLTISGGEPLVRADFDKVVEAMYKRQMNMLQLFTNGYRFNEEVIALLKKYDMNPQIVISFDGIGTHDWMRGRQGAQEEAERAIKLAADNGFCVKANVNVNFKTAPTMPETCKYLYDLGVRSIFFIRTSEGPKWIRSGLLSLTAREYWEVMLKVSESLRQENKKDLEFIWFNGPTIRAGATADDYQRGNSYQYESGDIKHSAWCFKAINAVYVSSTGRIMPCDGCEGVALQKDWEPGRCNVLNMPLKDILNNSSYSQLMKMSTEELLDGLKECRECEFSDRCHGGNCRVCGVLYQAVESGFSFENTDINLMLKAPLTCSFYKDGYYAKLLDILKD